MVTFAQAQERAEEWINGDVPSYQHREVRVREFELGFVAWAEDRADGPRSDGGGQRLVLARDSGEATLWPALPVGEVIRRYEEEYGRPEEVADAVPAAPARVDLNQTSFLLSPPEWLQEAADKLGMQEPRGAGAGTPGAGAGVGGSGPASAAPSPAPSGPSSGSRSLPETQAGVPAASAWPDAGGGAEVPGAPGVPAGATPWAGTDTNADVGEDRSVPLPATVFAPPLNERDDETPADAETALMSGGSQLPPTAVARALDDANARGGVGSSRGQGGGPGAGGAGGLGGTPGAPQGSTPAPYGYPHGQGSEAQGVSPGGPGPQGASAPPSYGYPQGPGAPGAPGAPGGPGGPGTPPSGGPQGGPAVGPSAYGYPQGPGGPGGPGASPSGAPQGGPGADPSAYGYPQGPDGAANVPHAPGSPGAPGRVLAPNAGDVADAATSKAAPPPRRARSGGSNP
ncbi:hypothetical protein R6V09_03140, partial [Streptomyces sp. W16]|nr:hypothetical protein [Streptomyces sp. W16]